MWLVSRSEAHAAELALMLSEVSEINSSLAQKVDCHLDVSSAPASESLIPSDLQQAIPFHQDLHGDMIFPSSKSLSGDAGFNYITNDRAFSLKNSGSPSINTIGNGAFRSFTFSATDGARNDAGLLIEESANPSGADSAWSMESEIIFFPRRVQPAVREAMSNNGLPAYEVTLPNGEKVLFDKKSKEIIGGALVETAPIDANTNRQTRKFAGLKYTGRGIMVRSDQRGESPKSAIVWGQSKQATVSWQNKTCKVPVSSIWKQSAANEGSSGLYGNDDDFYAMLRQKCNWNVSAADFP